MKQDIKNKVHIKLQELLKREPTPDELINSEKDTNLILEVLLDEVEELKNPK